MRLRASRLSTSICCSPIPRAAPPPPDPPPPSRSRCPHIRAILGRAYCMRASSTWSVASLVWARCAKISRITSSRSITQIPDSSSHSRCWDGASSLSNTMQSHSCAFANSTISAALPVPQRYFLCMERDHARCSSATPIPSVCTSSSSSSRRLMSSSSSRLLNERRTSNALSTISGLSLNSNMDADSWPLLSQMNRIFLYLFTRL